MRLCCPNASSVIPATVLILVRSTEFSVTLSPKSSSQEPGTSRLLPYPNVTAKRRSPLRTKKTAEALLETKGGRPETTLARKLTHLGECGCKLWVWTLPFVPSGKMTSRAGGLFSPRRHSVREVPGFIRKIVSAWVFFATIGAPLYRTSAVYLPAAVKLQLIGSLERTLLAVFQ